MKRAPTLTIKYPAFNVGDIVEVKNMQKPFPITRITGVYMVWRKAKPKTTWYYYLHGTYGSFTERAIKAVKVQKSTAQV